LIIQDFIIDEKKGQCNKQSPFYNNYGSVGVSDSGSVSGVTGSSIGSGSSGGTSTTSPVKSRNFSSTPFTQFRISLRSGSIHPRPVASATCSLSQVCG